MGDIEVIRRAPWWTAARLWTALAVAIAVLAGAVLWIALLRRTVARRSQQLAAEIEARHGAAVEFEATLRERTRLAADLHDTLEQSLTGLAFQLEAGEALIETNLDRSRRHLGLGQQLLSRSREDLRRSIWNLRSTALDEGSLVDTLHRVAVNRANGTAVTINVESEGEERSIPDVVAGNLLLLGQEAITNALKHGKPAGITLRLTFAAECLALQIEDDGRGFDLQTVAGPAGGHFGLQGMRERIKRLGGKLAIESSPGNGTRILASVPC
jgi:signal transduction histidine kinase